jgi:hypothetical protein
MLPRKVTQVIMVFVSVLTVLSLVLGMVQMLFMGPATP